VGRTDDLGGGVAFRPRDCANEMLDGIEHILCGLNEHSFQIPDKIAAVRAMRLLDA
jgi:hypothetical protein